MLKNLRGAAALVVLALAFTACASGPPLQPPPPLTELDANNPSDWGARKRFGALGGNTTMQWLASDVAIPTSSSTTKILFDTTSGSVANRQQFRNINRVQWTGGHCSQDIQIVCEVLRTGSTTWRTCPSQQNTDGTTNTTSTVAAGGTLVTASVGYNVDFLVQGPDWRIKAVTATAPSGCESDLVLFPDRELGQ